MPLEYTFQDMLDLDQSQHYALAQMLDHATDDYDGYYSDYFSIEIAE